MWASGLRISTPEGRSMSFARDLARARRDQRRLDLAGVGVHAAHDVLEVQDDVGHVLLDAR